MKQKPQPRSLIKSILFGLLLALFSTAAPAFSKTPAEISATAPTEDEVKTAVKAAWERAGGGMREAVTVEIKSVKIGTVSREWASFNDVGSKGMHIWTAKVHFITRKHYNTRTVAHDYDFYIDFSVNTLGEWVQQTSSQAGSKDSPLPDEPADVKKK